MKFSNNKKGISLIVLVITIIVMIILSTVIILSLNSDNIVNKAKVAKNASDIANLKHAASVAYSEYSLEIDVGTVDRDVTTAEMYVKNKLKEQGISDEQLKLMKITDTGDVIIYKEPVIPKGFVASDLETEDEVLEGLVIYEGNEKVSTDGDAQTTRNQYVWVPVDDFSKFERTTTYNGIITTPYYRYTEPFSGGIVSSANDLTGEYAEYSKMRASVENYGGFYIARYEAGKEGTDTVVSKKGVRAWTVKWGTTMTEIGTDGAVYRARSIYPESSNNEIVSTLIYGVQWDAVMNFMADVKNPNGTSSKYYIYDSKGMGWYSDNNSVNSSRITGKDVDEYASNKVKNIYDMAGNVKDWTMEASDNYYRVARGGWINLYGSASFRYSETVGDGISFASVDYNGFRIALYLK